jgi:cysteine desulfurase
VKQKNRSTLFHVDGVQAFGKVPLDLSIFKPDFYSVSAHKIGGPRGIGALFIKKPVRSAPLLQGGGQERQHRSGTENTAGIIGFETAASTNWSNSGKQFSNLEHAQVPDQSDEKPARRSPFD